MITLPGRSTLRLTIPFTKLTLKYTEHRPDAERGIELPSGVLTLLDSNTSTNAIHLGTRRQRIYTQRLLLDVPTPDFSMPYNVIIMSSTVIAVFFGLMHGALTRRWGWVELDVAGKVNEGNGLGQSGLIGSIDGEKEVVGEDRIDTMKGGDELRIMVDEAASVRQTPTRTLRSRII